MAPIGWPTTLAQKHWERFKRVGKAEAAEGTIKSPIAW